MHASYQGVAWRRAFVELCISGTAAAFIRLVRLSNPPDTELNAENAGEYVGGCS